MWGRGAVLTWAWAASHWVSTKRVSRASSREQGRSSRQRYLRSRFTDWSVSTEHPAGAGEGGETCSSRLVFLSSPRTCPAFELRAGQHQSCSLPIFLTDKRVKGPRTPGGHPLCALGPQQGETGCWRPGSNPRGEWYRQTFCLRRLEAWLLRHWRTHGLGEVPSPQ